MRQINSGRFGKQQNVQMCCPFLRVSTWKTAGFDKILRTATDAQRELSCLLSLLDDDSPMIVTRLEENPSVVLRLEVFIADDLAVFPSIERAAADNAIGERLAGFYKIDT